MSDDRKDLTAQPNPPQKGEQKEGTPAPSPGGGKRSLFGHLNSDLQNALSTWDTLTEQMANKISPEEEQLGEVKRLLGELKSKLQEFND